MATQTVLKGKQWKEYLSEHNLLQKEQMELYICTYNHTAIYKIGEYYFSLEIRRGYKNLTSLKRLV